MPFINPNLLVKRFLKKYSDPEIPVLLGLSGGPDSLMLFYLLLELNVKFGAAHVDHGWREESRDEAILLEQIAFSNQIPFHLHTLDPKEAKGNLEEFCRKARLAFFKSLSLKNGYQAVLLGHHADDQAETVLKRVFEGANLTSLTGLTQSSCIEDLKIWRPLLELRKKNILEWLNDRQLQAFEDKTNKDPKFLRARMRTSLIPKLSQEFGKEIASPLIKLAQESLELKDFLERSLEPYIERVQTIPEGISLDLSQTQPLGAFELKYLVRAFCQLGGLILSRQQLEAAAKLLQSGASNKKLLNDGKELHIHLKQMTLK